MFTVMGLSSLSLSNRSLFLVVLGLSRRLRFDAGFRVGGREWRFCDLWDPVTRGRGRRHGEYMLSRLPTVMGALEGRWYLSSTLRLV